MIKVELEKEDLINLVKGIDPCTSDKCSELERKGLMYFSGNQWVQTGIGTMKV